MPTFRSFFVLFTIVSLTEVFLFIQIGEILGVPLTILSVILTAAIGVSLLRIQGFETLRRMNQRAQQGEMPGQEMVEGVMLLISGALLLTPGFLTDAIGFLILTPPIRAAAAAWVVKQGLVQGTSVYWQQGGGAGFQTQKRSQTRSSADPDEPPIRTARARDERGEPHEVHIIEGEYERKDDAKKD